MILLHQTRGLNMRSRVITNLKMFGVTLLFSILHALRWVTRSDFGNIFIYSLETQNYILPSYRNYYESFISEIENEEKYDNKQFNHRNLYMKTQSTMSKYYTFSNKQKRIQFH